jgi:hypothetical protein
MGTTPHRTSRHVLTTDHQSPPTAVSGQALNGAMNLTISVSRKNRGGTIFTEGE